MAEINCILLVDNEETVNYVNEKLIQKLKITKELKSTLNGFEALKFIDAGIFIAPSLKLNKGISIPGLPENEATLKSPWTLNAAAFGRRTLQKNRTRSGERAGFLRDDPRGDGNRLHEKSLRRRPPRPDHRRRQTDRGAVWVRG